MAKRSIARYTAMTAALALTSAPLSAQGTSGLEFLSVPLGARAVALGEAYTGVAEGVEGMLFNPAAVASLSGASASLSVLNAADIFHQSLIAFGIPAFGAAALGLSINYQRFEPIPMTDLDGEQVGQFAPQTMVLSGTFGYRWGERLHTGVAAKWYRAELVSGAVAFLGDDFNGTASGLAFDLGLTYRVDAPMPLQLGAALLDFGQDPSFNGQSDRLPTRLRLGIAAHPLAFLGAEAVGPIDVMLTGDGLVTAAGGDGERGALGYGVEVSLGHLVYLRAGVPAALGVDDGRPLRYGVGVSYDVFRFDFARRMSEHPVLGQETHLTMSLVF